MRWRQPALQAAAFAALAAVVVLLFGLTSASLSSRGVQSGFAFLGQPAATPVTDSPIAFVPGTSTYARALLAGAANTMKLSVAAIVLATILGLLCGIGALSDNALVKRLSNTYVEVMRNVPVLLHVVLWYGLILELPAVGDASSTLGMLATNRGVFFPTVSWSGGLHVAYPVVDGLEVVGGLSVSPEFAALLLGIGLYTGAFIAEIVRAAVLSVDTGQWEAANSLALSHATTLRRVILPQAMRVALPPISSEYLGIFKNSTLAVAVGFQDFMAVGNNLFTDTGQVLEVMGLVMIFYAAVSLVVSALMHVVESRSRRWGSG